VIGCFTLLALAISTNLPEPVVLGPFPFGDLILADRENNWLAKDLKAAGVDLADVKKQMNGWKMYVVDHKIRGKDGAWMWFRPRDGGDWGAKSVVAGRLSIVVKDGRGEKVEIALTQCETHGVSTWVDGDGKGGLPYVVCPRHVTLRFHNLAVPLEGGIINYPKEGAVSLPRLRYDITGRVTVEKP
jgi:hypothetical protein